MRTSDFEYELPPEVIAQRPAAERADVKGLPEPLRKLLANGEPHTLAGGEVALALAGRRLLFCAPASEMGRMLKRTRSLPPGEKAWAQTASYAKARPALAESLAWQYVRPQRIAEALFALPDAKDDPQTAVAKAVWEALGMHSVEMVSASLNVRGRELTVEADVRFSQAPKAGLIFVRWYADR
jgi:hypothetical protein